MGGSGDRFLPSKVTPLSPAQAVSTFPDGLGTNAFIGTPGGARGVRGSMDRTEGKTVKLLRLGS